MSKIYHVIRNAKGSEIEAENAIGIMWQWKHNFRVRIPHPKLSCNKHNSWRIHEGRKFKLDTQALYCNLKSINSVAVEKRPTRSLPPSLSQMKISRG